MGALTTLGGIGDCDCEGGQITLALMYQGTGMVNIEWYVQAKGKGAKSADGNGNSQGALICVNNFVIKVMKFYVIHKIHLHQAQQQCIN
eukprot:TRINITY_DN5249_c0_g1_i1.p1 TRINITY_DN5249_c0_g1~~TRINITY_DN5249_c0_g1_i1.p1  ORF type:complete len:102 (+),score=19.08 TRINITY_DN5249_c0_g1_i1:42-308(+)